MVVYIGSLWHQDCDPFVTVVARTTAQVQEALGRAADDEYDRCLEDCDCDECEHEDNVCDCEECADCEINIMTGGVFSETSIRDYVNRGDLPEVIAALRAREVAYV